MVAETTDILDAEFSAPRGFKSYNDECYRKQLQQPDPSMWTISRGHFMFVVHHFLSIID
jgi:hypothetical protein